MTTLTLRCAIAAVSLGAGLAGPAFAQSAGRLDPASGTFVDTSPQAFLDGVKGSDSQGNKASLDEKGLTFTSADDNLKLRVGGKLQLDFGSARIRSFRFAKPYNDDVEFRRTWVEGYVTLYKSVEIAFQYDFADATRPINDAAIAYHGLDPFVFTVGNFKEPFSLNQLTSDNNLLFTERALSDAFAPARNFGFAVGAHGDAWTFAAGVFGGNANTGIEDAGIAGTARFTYAPILTKTEVLHLGVSGSYRANDQTGQSVSFSSKPESFLFTTALVSTGTLQAAENTSRVGFEAAYQTGPLRLQGEYILTQVDRNAGQPSTSFQGAYVEAGYTLNADGRPYTLAPSYGTAYAVFGAPKLDASQRISHGGIGIFELGARVSYIDLSDHNVNGGRELDYSFALNWYPEPNIKIASNYIRAHADYSPAAGRSVDSDIFVGRFQLYW
jgi:phosphate-selective porin OprO/OprP